MLQGEDLQWRDKRDRSRVTANAISARTMGVMMRDPLAEEGIIRGSLPQIVQKINQNDEFQLSGITGRRWGRTPPGRGKRRNGDE